MFISDLDIAIANYIYGGIWACDLARSIKRHKVGILVNCNPEYGENILWYGCIQVPGTQLVTVTVT